MLQQGPVLLMLEHACVAEQLNHLLPVLLAAGSRVLATICKPWAGGCTARALQPFLLPALSDKGARQLFRLDADTPAGLSGPMPARY